MAVIEFHGDIVTGDLNLDDAVMVCVPAKEHHNVVDLCFKEGMNIQVAEIHVNWLTHAHKSTLGYEIEKRWNSSKEKDARIKELEDQLRFLVDNDSINDSSIDKEVLELLSK